MAMLSGDDEERELSEFELIELFTVRPPDPERVRVGIGDDAAVVETLGRAVTSTDTAVEGVHFRREWSTAGQIGSKAVGAALSDLAAMGAGEDGIDVFVSLGAPRDTDTRFLRGIAAGVAETAGRHGATLTGGDTVSSPSLFLTVTVTAHVADGTPLVTRSGARPGDLVAVTGTLGAALAGLWLLENPGLPVSPELPAGVRRELITRQLDAEPRITAGAALARAGASAMIDLSDGLIADLGHIARRSSSPDEPVRIRVDAERLPSAPGVEAVARATGVDPLTPALTGGEEYELAVVLPAVTRPGATEALSAAGISLTVIGEVERGRPDGETPVRVLLRGEPIDPGRGGFDHFA